MTQLKDMSVSDLIKVDDTPLILEVKQQRAPVQHWVEANQPDIVRLLRDAGALLIRGLNFVGSIQLGSVLGSVFGTELLPYTFRSTPRTHFKGNIYTATEYHASEAIPQHNENSYANRWPLWIGFLCVTKPASGGRTPIASSRLVYERIPEALRLRFETKKIAYTRNHGAVDLPWAEVFQTDCREEVERFCESNDIEYSWVGRDGLRTRYVGQASVEHPTSKQRVWFNQAHLFHVSNLSEEQRRVLSHSDVHEPPRNAHYGDGSPIEEADLDCIRRVYDATTLSFEWMKGDLLLLDNMRYSHGRQPYAGARTILCGMAGAFQAPRLSPRANASPMEWSLV